MKNFYSKNEIPKLTTSGLKLLGKLGVMDKETWLKNFASGSRDWRLKQLRKLLSSYYLRSYPSPSINDVVALGKQGVKLLESHHTPFVTLPYPGQVDHDVTLSQILLAIHKSISVSDFSVEKELKSFGYDYNFMFTRDNDQKFPDSIIEVNGDGRPLKLAIEYERNGKSLDRCEAIIKSYSCFDHIHFVLFIVENKMIMDRFLGLFRKKYYPDMEKKAGFVLVDKFLGDPLKYPIEMPSGVTSLARIEQNILKFQSSA